MLLLITEVHEGGPGLKHLIQEEIAAYVLKASVMNEGSNNEVDEPCKSAIKKQLLCSARNDTVQ
jgi:hypothetical protein